MKRCKEPIRAHNHRPFRQLILTLTDAPQVVPCRVCLTDRAGSQIHDLVAVVGDVGIELGHTAVCPVPADRCKDVSERVGPKKDIRAGFWCSFREGSLGYGAVNVRDDDVIGFIPQEYPRRALSHTRVGRSDREYDAVGAVLQIQLFLRK